MLEDGFHAQAGSNFHAKIEKHTECTPSKSNSPPQNNGHDDEFAFQESKSQSMQNSVSYEFILHPNPGTFQIETNFPLSEISHLKIANTLEITVYKTRNLASNEIHLPNSVSGLYFVVLVLQDGTVLTQKMMVQREKTTLHHTIALCALRALFVFLVVKKSFKTATCKIKTSLFPHI